MKWENEWENVFQSKNLDKNPVLFSNWESWIIAIYKICLLIGDGEWIGLTLSGIFPQRIRSYSHKMGKSDHLTCLLRNLYAGQEATVRTGHGTTDWFQIRSGVHQGCILSPCLFNIYAVYIMRNAGLDEAQAGIKIAGRISITSDMQMTPPLWQKVKRNSKASWWKWKWRVKKLA